MSGRDSHGATWLGGWGNDRQLTRQQERRVRERNAMREVEPEVHDLLAGVDPAREFEPSYAYWWDWEGDIVVDGINLNQDPEQKLVWHTRTWTPDSIDEFLEDQ